MAKRMLSLLLAAVMVLGMVPAMNLSASAEEVAQVAPVASTPEWSADFDDVDRETGLASVWDVYDESWNTLACEEKEDAPGDYYMKVVGKAHVEGTTQPPFKVGTTFDPLSAIVVNLDAFRSANQKDGFRVIIQDNGNKTLAEVLVTYTATIQYRFNASAVWANATVSLAHGEWKNLSVAFIQSANENEDQLIITCGDQTQTVTGTCTESDAGAAQVLLSSPGNNWHKHTAALGIDNVAVYSYIPAKSVTLDKSEATLEVGKTLQLNASVPADVACITNVEWTSSNRNVATVDSNGLVTGVAAGSADITVTVTNADGSVATAQAAVTVEAAEKTLLWSADFDDASKVYDVANGGTVTNSVWSTYKTSVYTIEFPERASGDKYMKIISDKADDSGKADAFDFRTNEFAPLDSMLLTIDLLRATTNKDGLKIALIGEDGKAVAHVLVTYNGAVQYNFDGSSIWLNTNITVAEGASWTNLKVVTIQSETAGKDQLVLIYGDQTQTLEGDFASAGGVVRVSFQAPGRGYNKAVYSDALGIDNVAIYTYVPATGVALDKDSYALKSGETAQAAATVTPAVTLPGVKVEYSVEDTAVATVDANGIITGKAGGTTTLTAKVTNFDGTVVTDTATVAVEHVETVLWDSDFDNTAVTADGQYFNFANYPNATKWRPNADRFTNGDYDVKIVEDSSNSANRYLQIKAGAATTGTTKAFRYRTQSFTASEAIEISFKLWRNMDENGYWDNFSLHVHPYNVTDASMLGIHFGNDGCVTYPTADGTGKTAQLKANQWQDVRLVVIQNADDAFDTFKLYVDDVLMAQWIGCQYTSDYKTGNPHAFQLITSTGSNGLYTCVDTRIDDLKVRTYTPVKVEGLDVQETSITLGKTPVQLHAIVTPANADAYKITWTSSNEAVKVSDTGLISAVADGSATITATVTNPDGTSYSDSVEVTVDGENFDLLWSADFDDTDYVYDVPNSDTVTNSVWEAMSPSVYTVTYPEKSAGDKYMQIAGDKAGTDGKAATYEFQSTVFAPANVISVTMDLYRPVATKDGMRIRLLDNAGKVLATVLITHDGKIQYAFGQGGGSAWLNTFLVVPSEQWHTLKIVALQSQKDGADLLAITSGDSTETFVGNFTNTTAGVAQLRFLAPADGYNMEKYSEYIGIDNLQARVYAPTPATELTVPATMGVEEGRTSQLPVTVAPAEADLYTISYSAADDTVATVDANGKIQGVQLGGSTTITVTLTNANGTSLTKTVAVTVIEANPLIWEEDFDDKEIGSTGGFKVVNTNSELGSISVQDATGFGGTDNALVMDRDYGGLFTLNGGFELPATATKMVLEYRLLNTDTSHQNTVLPTLAGAHNNSKRFLSLFINNGMLYWNNGEAYSVQALSSQEWYTIKLIIDSDKGEFQLYLNGKPVASEQQLLYGNTGPITHVYFQSSTSDDQTLGDGLWMDDFKVYVYTPIESLELLDESMTLEGQSSAAIRVQTTPADANGQIIWTSSDESIAVVDGNGVVTGVTPGEVIITAATFEGASDTVKVIVKEVKPTDITVDQTSLSLPVGAHTYISAVAVPAHATPNTVTMASSDASIVTVDEWGEVVCLKAGTAKLIFTAGDITVEIPVTVTAAGVMETIQVSPTGTTIAQALARIAEINATQAKMTGNIEVVVADGYYYFADTLQMNELHGGTNGFTVIWKAAAGAKPVFGGALRIPGSSFTKDDKGIYSIDLSTLGVPKVADPDTMSTTRQLFVNNVRATRARSEGGLTECTYYKAGDTNLGHTSTDTYLASFARIKDLEFVYQELWTHPRAGVDSIIDNGDGTVSFVMDQPGWRFATNKGASSAGSDGPVWIENALELLDQPGEWYLNEETQVLYYMPRSWENMDTATVTLPLLESWDKDQNGISGLMHIAGTDYDNMVHNIHFEGITFADTTWTRPSSTSGHSDAQNNHLRETGDVMTEGSITVTRANGICFTGCTFTRLGITAVKLMKGVQNSHFVGNHFYDLSAGAINIGEPYLSDKDVANPSDRRKMMKNDDVLNNYIHNVAVDYNSSAAISLSWGPDMDFSYNEIFNMAYSGYHIGYGWTTKFENNLKNLVVSHNFIHDFMNEGVADGGGIYTIGNSGGDANNYNQVCYNFVKSVMDDSGPLYMDNGATFYEVHHNVVDLSKVTDWRGNTSISWLQMNSGAHHLKVHDNYATVKKYNDYAVDSEVEAGHVEDPNNWSAEAKAIIDGAGLQSGYAHLRNGHAELIVTNLDTFADLKVGDSLQIQVSYTDGKDVPVSGGRYICAFDSKNPDVVEVSADGKITALKSGKAVIRVWVVSNDILDVIEKTVYVEDTIEEVYLESYKGITDLSMSTDSDGISMAVAMKMTQGRMLKPEAENISYAVADEAVAKLVNGVLVPVSVGTTTLTIRVDLGDTSGEVTYNVQIVPALAFEDDYLEDVFNSQKSDWVNASVASAWNQIHGESLAVKTASWTTFSSRVYGNELLTFKLKLDTTTTGGWPCFVIRADSTEVNTAGGGASGYVLCFGKGEKGIELQRWNGLTRTMIIGNLAGFEPTSGIRQLLHNVDDGNEHLIQFGAVTDGGTTRLALWIDGEKYFDFLDDDPNAITAPGYFGIIGRNEVFYLSKTTKEEAYKEAVVGESVYSSAAEAIEAAKSGETVKLLRDVQLSGVLIKEGITLDLNGSNLKAEYLVAFGNGEVIDSTGDGLLKCENVRLDADNPMMPVWDSEAGGYRFFAMRSSQKYRSQSENNFVFVAKPILGKAANDVYMAMANNGLTVKAKMTWQNASGNEVEQLFALKTEDVQTVYSSDKVIQLTVNGTANYVGRLSTTTVVESDTGVIWEADSLPYIGE